MPIMNGNVATAEIRKIEYELKQKQFPKLSPLSEQEDYFSSPPITPSQIPITNDSTISGFSSFLKNNRPASMSISNTNNNLSVNTHNPKKKLSYRRTSNPDRLPFHSFNKKPKSSFSPNFSPPLSESNTTLTLPEFSELSPLSSPLHPSSLCNSSHSLIFALTGLASEEDKNIAYKSGVDGFLTKPVSLKTLEKLFKKWSERNELGNGASNRC